MFGKQAVDPPAGHAPWALLDDDYPDWERERHRCFVPTKGNPEKHWERKVKVTSLGTLFRQLGTKFSAADIFEFYLGLRPVGVKYSRLQTAQQAAMYCNILI